MYDEGTDLCCVDINDRCCELSGKDDMPLDDGTIGQLTGALHHWLEFSIICKREMLLSERYLAQPIVEFLSTEHSGSIVLEWNHPNLNLPQRGRPRQIDYALFGKDAGHPVVALETKWVTDTPLDKQGFVDDLLRLECVRWPKGYVARYFLVAGTGTNMESNFFGVQINTGKRKRELFITPVFSKDKAELRVDVADCATPWKKYFKSFSQSYNVKTPKFFKTQLISSCTNDHIHVYLWKVISAANRHSFDPKVEWKTLTVPKTDESGQVTSLQTITGASGQSVDISGAISDAAPQPIQ